MTSFLCVCVLYFLFLNNLFTFTWFSGDQLCGIEDQSQVELHKHETAEKFVSF